MPLLDQERPLRVHGQGEEVGVAEALADAGDVGRHRGRGVEVAIGLMAEHQRDPQIPVLDAVAPGALQQPLCARKPSPRAAHVSLQREVEIHPERAAHGAKWLTGVEMQLIGALQGAQVLLVAPEHVRRRGQPLKVGRPQRGRLIGG